MNRKFQFSFDFADTGFGYRFQGERNWTVSWSPAPQGPRGPRKWMLVVENVELWVYKKMSWSEEKRYCLRNVDWKTAMCVLAVPAYTVEFTGNEQSRVMKFQHPPKKNINLTYFKKLHHCLPF